MQQPAISLPPNLVQALPALAVVAALALGCAIVAAGVVRRGLHSLLGRDTPRERALIDGVARLTRLVTFLGLLGVLSFPALDIAGVSVPTGLKSEHLWQWLTQDGIRILVIVVIASVLVRVTAAIAARAEHDLSAGTGLDGLERRKRAQTIGSLVRRTLSFLIWAMTLLIVLRQLDVDITPVLTGAGIVGLAVGFGAQTLVRDVISGFFLIVEDQVRVGDVAEVNGKGGLVEQINLRTIVLRDLDGTVYVFPNGEIKALANRTKDFSYYVIDLPIDYEDDTDVVVDVVRAAADELIHDLGWRPHILEPLEVLGVDSFGDSQITLKFRIKTVPLKQWDVGRELRRRVKKTFDARGIRFPYPQLTLHFADAEALVAMRRPAADVAKPEDPAVRK